MEGKKFTLESISTILDGLINASIEEQTKSQKYIPYVSSNLFIINNAAKWEEFSRLLPRENRVTLHALRVTIDLPNDVEIATISKGYELNGTKIAAITPTLPTYSSTDQTMYHVFLENGTSIKVPSEDILDIEGMKGSIIVADPIFADYPESDLLLILQYELAAQRFDFTKTVGRWGIKNAGDFALNVQGFVNEGILKRRIVLETSMASAILRDLFICNITGLYRPFIYHKFQSDDIDTIFKDYSQSSIIDVKQKILESQYYHLGKFENEITKKQKSGEIPLTKSQADILIARTRRVVQGASLKNPNATPHWFDDAFKTRWHARLNIMNNEIVKTHIPEINAMDGETVSYFDSITMKTVSYDLRKFLGKHYNTLAYLFKTPFYYFKIETESMPWYMLSKDPFYDGICVTETIGGKNYDWNSPTIKFVPAKVSRFIAIHPLVLLSADNYGWIEHVKQIVFHEICHVLQEAYCNSFMYYSVLKNQYVHNDSANSYMHIKNIADDVDPIVLGELLKANMGRLYIVEKIDDMPPEERLSKNLIEYVQSRGGHTKGFMDIVKTLDVRQIGMKQRDLCKNLVIGPVMFRTSGESPGTGQVWL